MPIAVLKSLSAVLVTLGLFVANPAPANAVPPIPGGGGTNSPSSAPPFQWAQAFGGFGQEHTEATAVDAGGNVYLAGSYSGTVNFGGINLTAVSGSEMFLAKYGTNGGLQWLARSEGRFAEGRGIVVDAAGNVFLTGSFRNSLRLENTSFVAAGSADVFVARYNPAGQLAWATTFGGPGADAGNSLGLDASGNLYVVGDLSGTVDVGTNTLTSAGGSDIFLAQLAATDGTAQWARAMGGPGSDAGGRVAVDGAGNAHVTGYFSSSARFGGTVLTRVGGTDAFLAKYDATGSFRWVRQLGGAGDDAGRAVAVDPSGNIVVAGEFTGQFSIGASSFSGLGGREAFTAKFLPTGALAWGSTSGSSGDDRAWGVSVDAAANVFTMGNIATNGTFGTFKVANPGPGLGLFLTKQDANGKFLWATIAPGNIGDLSGSVSATMGGDVYVAADFTGDTQIGPVTVNTVGASDLLLARLPGIPPVLTTQPQSQTIDVSQPATFTVAARGSGTLNYQWRFNGTNLAGATNSTLVRAAGLTNAGAYSVLVSEAAGFTFSRDAVLTIEILGAPIVLAHPVDQLVSAGGQVTFKVSAKGLAPMAYQWFKDGAPIASATNATYVTPLLTVTDAGSYEVLVSNPLGAVASRPAVLTVVGVPEITAGLANAAIAVGESATFTVGTRGAGLEYVWVCNGEFVPGATNASLTIANAGVNDTGSYTVYVGNSLGLAVTAQATLTVDRAPVIRVSPQPRAVLLGQPAGFSVTAFGEGPLNYQWRRNGVDLPGETSATLNLPATDNRSAGDYAVRVSNTAVPAGIVSANARLQVTGPAATLALAGNQAVLNFAAAPTAFLLEATSDLGPNAVWTVVADLSTVPGNSISLPANPAAGPRFYRLRTP